MKTEHEEQRELVKWFRQTYLKTLIFAIPNGGARNIATASRLKAEGVVKGVPDLFIPAWELWIEMKRAKGGIVSFDQNLMHLYLRGVGYTVIVAKGFEDARQQIEELKHEVEQG
jgi:hypothetical protein